LFSEIIPVHSIGELNFNPIPKIIDIKTEERGIKWAVSFLNQVSP